MAPHKNLCSTYRCPINNVNNSEVFYSYGGDLN